ncbi:MAG: M1 family metallopeptidase [Rhodothermia bacterium]|nr:M1 family metallopeptidase [Rhodothermia bacterium]
MKQIYLVMGFLGAFGLVSAQPKVLYQGDLVPEKTRPYDVLHYKIELKLDFEQNAFYGETTIQLRALQDRVQQLELDAETFSVMEVQNIHKQPLTFAFTPSSERRQGGLVIDLERALSYNDTLSVVIRYEAKGVKPIPTQFGMSADYDLGLTFKDANGTRPRLANTLSFPEGARHWFPCNDTPNDKASQELIAHVPANMQAISNGALVSETVHDGTRTAHWRQEKPHSTYLSVLVVGDYQAVRQTYGTLSLAYWVYPKAVPDALRSFNQTPQIMAFMERLFGMAFPWDRYDQITIPGIGGGAESTAATVVGESTIHDERADLDFPSHWLVAHEAAHQWFGNLVTARSWPETWLNESFATFAENDYIRASLGDKEGEKYRLDKWNGYLQEANTKYLRPIRYRGFALPNEHFDRHTYNKGSLVLHYLRNLMGEDHFTRAISLLLQRHAFQPVTTENLKDAIKDATGMNFDGFMDQWIDHAGHPSLEVSYEWDASDLQLKLRIRQLQDVSAAIPLFKLKTHILLNFTNGTVSIPLEISKADSTYYLTSTLIKNTFSGKPTVNFDRFMTIPMQLRYVLSKEEWLSLLKSSNFRDQILAIEHFGKNLDEHAAVLREEARLNTFWGVRQAITNVFVGTNNPIAYTDFFLTQLSDAHSRVRVSAVRGIAATKQKIHAKQLRLMYKTEKSYLVQAEILRALGSCGDLSDIPLLSAALASPSPRNILQSAANDAIQMVKKPSSKK